MAITDVTVIADGETATETVTLADGQGLTVEPGGTLDVDGAGIVWAGGEAAVSNGGLIRTTGEAVTATEDAAGDLVVSNLETGIIEGTFDGPRLAADATFTLNNAGVIRAEGRVIDLGDAVEAGASAVINNLAGGRIEQTGNGGTDLIRPGAGTTINNWGTIVAEQGHAGGGDLIDYQENAGGTVNNHAGGLLEGARHAVTGDRSVTVENHGTMIGRNGSAVNIDNEGTEEERVFVTNHGRMEGRSAGLADSDGDAIDADGLLTLDNYGFVGGMGHNGYHDGEPNLSEGLAIGGGMITNHAGGEIYGYGRAIQVDNSSNANALGTTTIVNHGIIRGDGNGPAGVTPEEEALFADRLRGAEAINLLGSYGDDIVNSGEIVGGVSMGGGNDALTNSGTITATGGSAVNMGDGDDTVTLEAGFAVEGDILLGAGNDVLTTAAGAGQAALRVEGGAGDDRITAGSGDDVLVGGAGADRIEGGMGTDTASYAGSATGVEVWLSVGGQPLSRGGDAEGDMLVSIENLDGSAQADILAGDGGRNVLRGEDGADRLYAYGGDDLAQGGEGNDLLGGGDGDDQLQGGAGHDRLYGQNDDDVLEGGEGNDWLYGESGNDRLAGGEGRDLLNGGVGDDVLEGGAGADHLGGLAGSDTFVFADAAHSAPGAGNRDTIIDFTAGEDLIDLGGIDADATAAGDQGFAFAGQAAFSGVAGELVYRLEGGETIVAGDVDGDGVADFEIALTGTVALSAGDFLL